MPIITAVALPMPEIITQTHCQITFAMLFAETNSVLMWPIIIESMLLPMLHTVSLSITGAPVFIKSLIYGFTGTKKSANV